MTKEGTKVNCFCYKNVAVAAAAAVVDDNVEKESEIKYNMN